MRVWARRENSNRRRAQVAPVYVLCWLTFLVAVLFAGQIWTGSTVGTALVLSIATYRLTDVFSLHAVVLLSRSQDHTTVGGYERNLIMLAWNVLELSLICGLWLRAGGAPSALSAWYGGFTTATLAGAASAPSGSPALAGPAFEAAVGTVMTLATAVILFLGGAATLISLIGRKFQEYRD